MPPPCHMRVASCACAPHCDEALELICSLPKQRPEEFLSDTPEAKAVDVSSAISATAGAVLEVTR